MKKPITMPALSDTMTEGTLVEWLKQPSDRVNRGDVIAEIETDKTIMELEAFDDGWLAPPLAEPDSTVKVGEVIGYLADSPEATRDEATEPPAAQKTAENTQKAPETPAEETSAPAAEKTVVEKVGDPLSRMPSSGSDHAPASPYARALATDLGIELAQVMPAADGIIHAAEVVAAAMQPPQADLSHAPAYRLTPLRGMRRAMAQHMQKTVHTPTFHVTSEIDLKTLKEAVHAQSVSLTVLLAKRCAEAIKAHPRINAAWTPQGVALFDRIDIGIAVDVPDGLITPVLRNVGETPLQTLNQQGQALKQRAMDGTLKPDEYQGATFYISNLGVFSEVVQFDAIVPLGASAILAVAAAKRGKAHITLRCDHRVLTGADAARFVKTLRQQVELTDNEEK